MKGFKSMKISNYMSNLFKMKQQIEILNPHHLLQKKTNKIDNKEFMNKNQIINEFSKNSFTFHLSDEHF